MVSSIEELRITAANLRKEGLNSQQIADELSLSQDTISWLLAGNQQSEERPTDVSDVFSIMVGALQNDDCTSFP